MPEAQRNLFGEQELPWEEDAQTDQMIAKVALVDAPYGPFDYLVPDDLRDKIGIGMRVRVPLGRGNRTVTGYCAELIDPKQTGNQVEDKAAKALKQAAKSVIEDEPFALTSKQTNTDRFQKSTAKRSVKLKPISTLVDDSPLLTPELMRLAKWISSHYLSQLGTVIECMVPAAVRDKSGTREQTFLTVPNHVFARLTQLQLPPKQASVLKALAGAGRPMTANELADTVGCTSAPVNALRKKGLLNESKERVSVHEANIASDASGTALQLNPEQSVALKRIVAAIHEERPQTLLLHGITGSGKTEVYIQAIEEVIRFGRQAIVLVPEISLTPQTRHRFRQRFPRVAVLHSHLSAPERHHQWKMIARGEVQVIVGARSAIFAPAPNLGLIVLDEEHDNSFKQDKTPRYHAREVALQRSQDRKIPVLLGSATPSLESWQAVRSKQFELIQLPHRVMDLPLPDVRVVDLRVEFRERRSKGMISRPMHAAIRESLTEKGQVILLLNRRGFARHIQCPACGKTLECPHCEIAMTHHRDGEQAICHYCDYRRPSPRTCVACDFEGIKYAGYGTQKLEDEVASRFPDARVLRMDSDSMQRQGSHERALDSFRKGEIDILLGTQMIAKGLDFPNVTLVGVVSADTSLHFPDFRAGERTFGLVTQVAGRSGRGEKGGRVLVQTFSPEHPAIEHASTHHFEAFAEQELEARAAFGYPPFCHMARFVFRGESETQTVAFASAAVRAVENAIAESAASNGPLNRDGSSGGAMPQNESPEEIGFDAEIRVVGPAEAAIGKIRNRFRFHAMVMGKDWEKLHKTLATAISQFPASRDVEWIVDVDPMDML